MTALTQVDIGMLGSAAQGEPFSHQDDASAFATEVATMTVIIEGGTQADGLRAHLEAIRQLVPAGAEIRVICDRPWPDAPKWVNVVTSRSSSRGDRLDQATEGATGELLAFLDASVMPQAEWTQRAFEIFRDPTVAAAGGPHLLPAIAPVGERAAWLVLSSRLGAGPLAYRFTRRAPRDVLEMPTTNMVVRRSAFEAVGGFQSPSPLGDDARLCYKLRTLLGLRVVYDPGLAVEALPPPVDRFFTMLMEWGRKRGDLLRRLPETARAVPHGFAALWLLSLGVLVVGSVFTLTGRLILLGAAMMYLLAGLWLVIRSRHLRAGALAAVGLPICHLAYSAGVWRGFLGRNLGEAVPGRFRDSPLRILVMNWRDITHPWAGGAEAYMHELARRWVREGIDVGWVSGRYPGAPRLESVDGIRVHRVGGHFSLYPLAALTFLFRLRSHYDVIIDCENGIPFFAPLYSRKPVILVVHHVHSEVFRTELPKHLRWLALFLEGWLMPRVYRRNEVVTVSPSTRADLEAAGYEPQRIGLVPNGVDLPEIRLPEMRSPTPLLLYLGRLKRYKSVDVLLRAMPALLKKFPQARLAIVGQGTDRKRLERLAWKLGLAGSVRFYGYLDRARRDQLLAQAWIAVCPSAFEGFGVSCLEASAWGIPVVAARVPGLKDAVLDDKTGVLVPYGDWDHLADTLGDLLDNRDRRDDLGRAGREWAATHSWNASAQLFLDKVRVVTPARVSAPALRSA